MKTTGKELKNKVLYWEIKPCARSGLCCKTSACPYGEWDPLGHKCIYLEIEDATDQYVLYECSRYDYIKKQIGSEWAPAFGAGCCKTLFNEARERNILFSGRTFTVDESVTGISEL